jgi:hypothetical protein
MDHRSALLTPDEAHELAALLVRVWKRQGATKVIISGGVAHGCLPDAAPHGGAGGTPIDAPETLRAVAETVAAYPEFGFRSEVVTDREA